MSKLNDKILSLAPGARIMLFEIDLSRMGGPLLRLTPSPLPASPKKVLRFVDASQALAFYRHMPVLRAPAGRRVSVEFYFRSSNTSYPQVIFRRADSQDGQNNARFRHTNMTASAATNGSSPLDHSTGRISIAQAGEYVHAVYSAEATPVSESVGFWLMFNPCYGNSTANWDRNNRAEGYCDVATFRLSYEEDGRRIPLLVYEDPDFWGAYESNPFEMPTVPMTEGHYISVVPIWQGQPYTPVPIEAGGFEARGTGQFPRPRLRISNLFNETSQLTQEFGDLRGAVVRRRKVFADHLDNGPFPDPLSAPPADVFVIDRKSSQNNTVTEWELASVLDQQGAQLPARQILRDTCPFAYRVWDGTAWVYAAEDGCPYTGPEMYDENGQPVTNPAEDKCSHRLSTGCRARFGTKEDIPFGGFPMVGRLR